MAQGYLPVYVYVMYTEKLEYTGTSVYRNLGIQRFLVPVYQHSEYTEGSLVSMRHMGGKAARWTSTMVEVEGGLECLTLTKAELPVLI